MKTIWAPWRMEYIVAEKERRCVFCGSMERGRDEEDFVLARGKYCFVVLNKYPYNSGHLMVVPYRHSGELGEIESETMMEIMSYVSKSCDVLKRGLSAEGFNVGINLGEIAGAGIADHVHFHVVPRWAADTNFMPVLADTKVMPVSLQDVYNSLKKVWGVS